MRRFLLVRSTCMLGATVLIGCATTHKSAGDESLNHRADAKAVADVQAGKRAVASAAWWGFDEQDSTAALQAAIRSGAKKLVVPKMGKPWMVGPLVLQSNQEIVFEPGAVVMARAGAFLGTGHCLLSAQDKENITLTGPGASLVMRKQDYANPPYAKGEWRHCLSLMGCRNVTVQGLRLASSGGDGIYLGHGGSRNHCQDITIKDVTCEDHHRQGISIITAENLLIEGCTLRNTQGTAPQAGVDFEPNGPHEHLVHCVLRDCVIEHNAGFGVLLYLGALRPQSEPISIAIERCQVRDNREGSLGILGAKEAGDLRGTVMVRGNTFAGDQHIDPWPRLQVQREP